MNSAQTIVVGSQSVERLCQLHVDVHGRAAERRGFHHSVVGDAFGIPHGSLVVAARRDVVRALDELAERLKLANGLAVVLVNPFLRAVSRNYNQRQLLVVSLGNRRSIVEQRRSRSAYQRHGGFQLLSHAERHIGGTALVDNDVSLYAAARKGDNQRSVALARRHHGMPDAVEIHRFDENLALKFVGGFFFFHSCEVISKPPKKQAKATTKQKSDKKSAKELRNSKKMSYFAPLFAISGKTSGLFTLR